MPAAVTLTAGGFIALTWFARVLFVYACFVERCENRRSERINSLVKALACVLPNYALVYRPCTRGLLDCVPSGCAQCLGATCCCVREVQRQGTGETVLVTFLCLFSFVFFSMLTIALTFPDGLPKDVSSVGFAMACGIITAIP